MHNCALKYGSYRKVWSTDQRTRPSTPLASLSKALAKIARARTTEAAIKTLRDTARSVTGCDGIAIILKDGDLCHYVEEDAIGSLWKGQKFPSVACVSGWSMMNRATAVIPDIGQDDRIPLELYAGTFVRAMAPIRVENPMGAISAYWSQPYTPADWEVEVLEALGEATATAFENAAFVESVTSSRVPAKNEVETLAGEFAHDIERISGIAAVPTMLDVILRMTLDGTNSQMGGRPEVSDPNGAVLTESTASGCYGLAFA